MLQGSLVTFRDGLMRWQITWQTSYYVSAE
jgi:hypothetical protein